MDNSRLPAKALETMATGTRTRGRPKMDSSLDIKKDTQKRGSNIRQAVECVRQESLEYVHLCSPIVVKKKSVARPVIVPFWRYHAE